MASLNDWTVLQNSNQRPDNVNQQALELSQSSEPLRIQKVIYPDLTESVNCYVEMAPEVNNIHGSLNGQQEDSSVEFQIQTFKYISLQCLAIGFGSFLGIFKCYAFFFVKLVGEKRYQRWPMDFSEYCRLYYYHSYQNSDCEEHYNRYSEFMDDVVDSHEHYRWTFYVLIALIIAQWIAIVLLRQTSLLKRYQGLNYGIQTAFFSCVVLSITNHDSWMYLHLWFIPISILLFLICQLQILNLKKFHYHPKQGQILTVLVYAAFLFNTMSAFNSNDFVSNIVICEFAIVYLAYYLIQLDQSLKTSQIQVSISSNQPIEEPKQVSITQIIQQIFNDQVAIEQATMEQVSKHILLGAGSLLILFILSLTNLVTLIIMLGVLFILFDAQVISSKARFEKDDYFIASSLVFIDFACPIKNIYRSIKNSRSQ